MALLSIDNRPALAAAVRLPARGVWTATLDLDATEAPSGRVSIACDGAAPLVGTVLRGAVGGSVARVLVVGGAGGLRGELAALALQQGTLGDVLAATLREAGETLSATSATLADRATARWHRAAGPAARAVASLAATAGMTWRVLRDGTVWLGVDAFDDAPAGDRTVVARDPALGLWSWGADALDVVPGELVTLGDDAGLAAVRVAEVRYVLDGDRLTATATEAP